METVVSFPLQSLSTNIHAYYTNTGGAKKMYTNFLRDVIYVLFFEV